MTEPPRPPLLARLVARCWYVWGLSLAYTGQRMQDRSYFRAAADAFGRAVAVWPGLAEAYFQRGVTRGRELGDYHGAVTDLNRVADLRPAWPEPYLQRGLFHRFNGHSVAARADLAHYIELAPAGYWRDEAARQLADLEAEL